MVPSIQAYQIIVKYNQLTILLIKYVICAQQIVMTKYDLLIWKTVHLICKILDLYVQLLNRWNLLLKPERFSRFKFSSNAFNFMSTLSCKMLKNNQAYFKNLAVFTLQHFESMCDHFSTLCVKGLIPSQIFISLLFFHNILSLKLYT